MLGILCFIRICFLSVDAQLASSRSRICPTESLPSQAVGYPIDAKEHISMRILVPPDLQVMLPIGFVLPKQHLSI